MSRNLIKLEDILTVNQSSWSKREGWSYLRYLDTANITNGRIDEIVNFDIKSDKIPSRARRIVQEGDFVYSTVRPNQKHFGLLKNIEDNLVVSTGFAVMRSKNPEQFDTRFIYHLVTQDFITNYLHGIAENNTSAYPALKPKDITDLEFEFPAISDQRSIADFFENIDDKIEVNQKMNQTLEDIAKAIFKSWFVDFDPVRAKAEGRPTGLPIEISDLFPDELVDSEFGEIPNGWNASVAGELFDCLDNRRVPLSKNERAKRKGSIPYYGATGIIDQVDEHIFDGNFLLLGEDGSVEKEDGTAFTQYVSGKIWVNNHAHVLIGKDLISTEYLYLAFQFIRVSPYVTGAVQLKISQTNLRSIPIPSPTLEISEYFQKIIKPIFDRRVQIEKENKILSELRDTLLPKLISGALRIPDAEKFLEEAGV